VIERAPLWAYGLLLALFVALVAAVTVTAKAQLDGFPPAFDLVLLALASYRVTRVISQSRIGLVLRAPLTSDPAGEEPKGTGMTRAVAELVLCVSCLSVWVAAAFSAALVAFPRETRLIAFVFAVAAATEFLLIAFLRMQGD
jgi:hypothetical protein